MAQGANPAMTPEATLPQGAAAQPSLGLLLWIWILLGLQSFGGGTATLFLIRRAAVERYRWLTPAEFTRDWALCQAAPGINLLCMTILVGRQVAGFAGALVALVGLMFPSVGLTILMIALYADLRTLPVVQAALHGVVPGTVGLGLLLTYNMARPLLESSYRESVLNLFVGGLILVGSAVTVLVWHWPVIVVLCSAGALGALTTWWQAHQRNQEMSRRP
ncbi:MAG: chromate transporter [Caldilineaceae bacterium]|nr:chromate transporter [Caldilineaceae bacterium]